VFQEDPGNAGFLSRAVLFRISSQDDKLIFRAISGEHNALKTNTMRFAMGNAVQLTQRSDLKAPSLVAEFVELRRALRGLFDPYHPERHYMRGPGPKWYAKHNLVPTRDDARAANRVLQLGTPTITVVDEATASCPA
jgi:hypothetical protein